MSSLAALFAESPWAAWAAVCALLLGAELASGRGRLTWPALAAAATSLVSGIGLPIELPTQIAVFAALMLVSFLALVRKQRAVKTAAPRPAPAHGLPTPKAAVEAPRRSKGPRQDRSRGPASTATPAAATASRSAAPQGRAARAPAVVGARGRSLGEFCNGVGRVWIDRAEWAAELIQGEALAPDRDIEVVGVSGGVRLRVRPGELTL